MNTLIRRSVVSTVLAAGLLAGGVWNGTAHAETRTNVSLATALRLNAQQAVANIRHQALVDLHQTAGTLDMPYVELGPTTILAEWHDAAGNLPVDVQLRIELLSKALAASSLESLHRMLLLAPVVVSEGATDE